jgi:hypothetical protein
MQLRIPKDGKAVNVFPMRNVYRKAMYFSIPSQQIHES